MERMVSARQMTTVVDKLCASACTLVFLSGNERIIAPGAQLGFHAFWSTGLSDAEMAGLMQTDRDFMAAAGVSASFIDKAFATPSNDVWFPKEDELKHAGVVTQVTAKYAIAVGKYGSSIEERAELIGEILAAIHKQSPQDYTLIHQDLLHQLQSDSTASDAISASDVLYNRYLNKFMAHSSDAAAAKFLRTYFTLASEVGARNSQACYFLLARRQTLSESGANLYAGSAHVEDLLMAMLRTAADGIRRNRPVPSESDRQEGWVMVYKKFIDRHPGDLQTLEKINSPAIDRAAACRAELSVYDAMLSLPESYQGMLARSIVAEAAHESAAANDVSPAGQLLQPGRQNGR